MNHKFSKWPHYDLDEIEATKNILMSGNVNYWTGSECRQFEKEFSEFINVKYSIALANGTVALDLALIALNIKCGDEVLVTPRSFIASVSSVVNIGAKPIFCDVDLNSGNISPLDIENKITKKTKAIVCVHLAGFPCDMDEIMLLAQKHNLYVIEDCAQAHGAIYKNKKVGSIGHVACWSFCQDKIISTGGEGGMVTTNIDWLWSKMWSYKDHGKSWNSMYASNPNPGFRFVHDSFGTNWRMTEIQAAIGRIQLKKLNKWTDIRNIYANRILNVFKEHMHIRVPKFISSFRNADGKNLINRHAYYKLYVYVETKYLRKGWNRNKIAEAINSRGGLCFYGSCPEIYLEKAFANTSFKPLIRLKNAKKLGETSLMFLVHPTLTEDEIEINYGIIREVLSESGI